MAGLIRGFFFTDKAVTESFGLKKWQEKAYIAFGYFLQIISLCATVQCIFLFDETTVARIVYLILIIYPYGVLNFTVSALILLFTPSLSTITCFFKTSW